MSSLASSSSGSGSGKEVNVPAQIHRLAGTINKFSFNWDRSQVAVAVDNSPAIHVYADCHKSDCKEWMRYDDNNTSSDKAEGTSTDGSEVKGYAPTIGERSRSSSALVFDDEAPKGKPYYLLEKHSMVITGIDWHPRTNKIVTCSQDRTAFVWVFNLDEDRWEPQAVVLRFYRAAMCCKWSPDGDRFAVGGAVKKEFTYGKLTSCSGNFAICSFEAANNWWVGRSVKRKVKSTITCLSWHPDSQSIAVGFCDFCCRVYSTEKGDFGTVVCEFDNARGWITDVSWSPTGQRLAFTAHDSSLTVVRFFTGGEDEDDEGAEYQHVKHNGLPYAKCQFLLEEPTPQVVCVGHELNPHVYSPDDEGIWTLSMKLDNKEKKKAKKTSAFAGARAKFGGVKGKSNQVDSKVLAPTTKHDRLIHDIAPHEPTIADEDDYEKGRVTRFTTAGVDGKIIIWDTSKIVS